MSASTRPTRWACIPSASARFADTVDLPTPPLPLATAIIWRTPSRAGIDCGPGCMGFLWLLRVAQLAEQFQGVDAGVVAVGPNNLVGVVAAGEHLTGHGRADEVAVAEQLERVGRLGPFLIARGARAIRPQLLEGDERAGPVGP